MEQVLLNKEKKTFLKASLPDNHQQNALCGALSLLCKPGVPSHFTDPRWRAVWAEKVVGSGAPGTGLDKAKQGVPGAGGGGDLVLPLGGLPAALLHLPQRGLLQPLARELGHHGASGALRRHPVQRARGVQANPGPLLRLPWRVRPPPLLTPSTLQPPALLSSSHMLTM